MTQRGRLLVQKVKEESHAARASRGSRLLSASRQQQGVSNSQKDREKKDDSGGSGNVLSGLHQSPDVQLFKMLEKKYHMGGAMGEGTFSYVHLGFHKETGCPVGCKVLRGVNGARRILMEMNVLQLIRGEINNTELVDVYRYENMVCLLMKYLKGTHFREFIRRATVFDIREYLFGLLKALAGAHEKGIMHRDIKPTNFLVSDPDPKTWKREYMLVDFGLAELDATCFPDFREKMMNFYDELDELQGPAVILSPTSNRKAEEYEGIHPEEVNQTLLGRSVKYPWLPLQSIMKDMKPRVKRASMAGTKGFRAPEVILRDPTQTIALDIWSVGVVMLSLLTWKYPFFDNGDDAGALLEIVGILGTKRLESVVRDTKCSVELPQPQPEVVDLVDVIKHYREVTVVDDDEYEKMEELEFQCMQEEGWKTELKQAPGPLTLPRSALDLLSRLLEPSPRERITAAAALQHRFLRKCRESDEHPFLPLRDRLEKVRMEVKEEKRKAMESGEPSPSPSPQRNRMGSLLPLPKRAKTII